MLRHTVNHVKLANGSEGLFIDTPDSSVVSIDIVFRAGDYLSPKGKMDTAHVLEHMVLGANEKYPTAREFSKEFTKYGAYNNAYTGDYQLGYDAECEISEVQRIVDLLCVAIESPLFTEKDFDAEIGNVREELKMRKNNEDAELAYCLEDKLGFVPISYELRTEELNSVTLDDIKEHYEKTHKGSNMRFIIVGPIASEVDGLKKRLEAIELGAGDGIMGLPDERPRNLPDPLVLENSSLDNVCYRYEVVMPKLEGTKEHDSLVALYDLLFDGFHSRVFGELREKGLVYGIHGGTYDTKYNTMGVISGQVQDVNIDEVFAILNRELNDVAQNGIKDNELADLRKKVYGELQRQHQTVGSINSWYRDDFMLRDKILPIDGMKQRLDDITVESVKQAAQKLLANDIAGLGFMQNPKQTVDAQALQIILTSR